MKILQVISSLNPAGGGPAACFKAITPALAALGHESECVCVDSPNDPFLRDMPAKIHAVGPAKLGYAYAAGLQPWLEANAARFDAVIVHGLWQYHGLAVHRALARLGPKAPRYFVFSHGMLDPWFQRQYPLKHIKKLFYWWLAERRVLRNASAVLFTCEEELRLARNAFPKFRCTERVVTFGTTAPDGDPTVQREAFYARFPTLRDRPFYLFLGRIHLKKGMDLLIDAYADLAAKVGPSLPPLMIAGPCADEDYLKSLHARAATRCPAGSVLWPGMISGDVKWGALRAAEVFMLPSHQENFGIAVAEALACGTPVLISDKVNIWREIEADGAGLVETDTLAGTAKLFNRWRALSAADRAAMVAASTRSFTQRYEIDAVARSLVQVLQAR